MKCFAIIVQFKTFYDERYFSVNSIWTSHSMMIKDEIVIFRLILPFGHIIAVHIMLYFFSFPLPFSFFSSSSSQFMDIGYLT